LDVGEFRVAEGGGVSIDVVGRRDNAVATGDAGIPYGARGGVTREVEIDRLAGIQIAAEEKGLRERINRRSDVVRRLRGGRLPWPGESLANIDEAGIGIDMEGIAVSFANVTQFLFGVAVGLGHLRQTISERSGNVLRPGEGLGEFDANEAVLHPGVLGAKRRRCEEQASGENVSGNATGRLGSHVPGGKGCGQNLA
jgi:hypothetical protein